ncbi:MAG TPA: hypothetical protein ENK66_04975, partial [Arcobacter sp.]|nr:hypothetical protein [Arcobacter sp.]
MFKFLSLKQIYVIVFLSLIFWAFFAFYTMNQLIASQEKYANLINISGKQRMLSQKTTLMVKRYLETQDKKLFIHSMELHSLMENDHNYILKNLTSQEIKSIYYNEPYLLDKKLQLYFSLLDSFHKKPTKNLANQIESYSFDLLPKLNDAVYAFEKEANEKIVILKEREMFILIGTLLTIILEALLIVLPSLKKIKHKEDELLQKNITLEEEIKKEIEIVRKQEQILAKNSKLTAMGEMIENIAHQWRQPLSIIATSATALQFKNEINPVSTNEINQTCIKINENAQYLSNTIENFRQYLKGDSIPVRFDMKNNSNKFIKFVEKSIEKYHIQVILDLHEDIKVNGYPNELIECFINIFNNSKDIFLEKNYSHDNRFIFISQKVIENKIIITFKDNAGGMPTEVLPRVFEPYFTTKHQTKGTGLGLSITYNLIVNGMNGSIEVENVEFT